MTTHDEPPDLGPPPLRPYRASLRRNLTFLALALVALTVVVATFWKKPALPGPEDFDPSSFTSPKFTDAVNKVDDAFAAAWQDAKLSPVAPAPDLIIARRLSLALTGSIPSLEEIRALEAQPEDERIQWWLTRLFEDRRYADFIAERFARSVVGVENGPFLVYRRHRLVEWLADQFQNNRPYDDLVQSLITSEGIWTNQPEVNFITVSVVQNNPDKKGPDEAKLATRVSRAFLGARIDCMECHDDRFGDRWKQEDFHQLAAFFGTADMTLSGLREDPKQPYEYRYNGMRDTERVPAKVPFQPELLPKTGTPRERLASWVTHPDNRAFARAAVNRTWAILFNKPLITPVDDIPLEGPWPPALEILADDFIAHDFDLQHLIRTIAATQVFQLDSRSADPEQPVTTEQTHHWAAFPLTRLRPEQVAGSIIQASSLNTLDDDAHVIRQIARFFQQNDFIKRFGDQGEDEFEDRGGTIPQRLLMMNGELVSEKTKNNIVLNAATRIATLAPDDLTAIKSTYLAALSRLPSPPEESHFLESLKDRKGKARIAALNDLFWTLMNATEFSWNH
ncbi:MAG: DUF1549 domain-containing protein [Verrucomicrobiota bacterium]